MLTVIHFEFFAPRIHWMLSQLLSITTFKKGVFFQKNKKKKFDVKKIFLATYLQVIKFSAQWISKTGSRLLISVLVIIKTKAILSELIFGRLFKDLWIFPNQNKYLHYIARNEIVKVRNILISWDFLFWVSPLFKHSIRYLFFSVFKWWLLFLSIFFTLILVAACIYSKKA